MSPVSTNGECVYSYADHGIWNAVVLTAIVCVSLSIFTMLGCSVSPFALTVVVTEQYSIPQWYPIRYMVDNNALSLL